MTVPVHPITDGGVLAKECKIWNTENDQTLRIYQVTKTHTEQLTLAMTYMVSSLEQRIFLSRRNVPGGITVFNSELLWMFLCLIKGNTFIKCIHYQEVITFKVTEASVDVEVCFLPYSIYPQCQSAPAVVEKMSENVPLTLTYIYICKRVSCGSYPAVELSRLRFPDFKRTCQIDPSPYVLDKG